MLWLDLDTGSITDSQKRPKGNWVVVMLISTDYGNFETTFDGIKRFAKVFGVQDYDIEKIDKDMQIWAEEENLSKMLKDNFGTYFNIFFDDGMIEITLNKNATDETKGQPAPSNTGVDEDELPSTRSGGGGGGGKGMPSPDGDPSDDEGEGDSDDGEGDADGDGDGDGEPSDGDSDKDSDKNIADEEEGESKNPFEEGEKKGKEIPDSLKEKLQGNKEGDSSESGEGSGEGSDTDSEGGDGQSDSDSQGQGDGGDTESDSQDSSQGQGEGDADGQGEGEGEQGDSDSDSGDGDDSDGDSESGEQGDSDSDSDSDSGEEGENGEGDSDSDNEGDSDSEKGEKSDKETDKEGKSDESGDNEGESDSDDDSDNEGESGDGENPSDDGKPALSPEGQEILDALKEQCQNARDNAEEAMKEPDSEEAIEQYEDADEALNEALSLCEDEGVNPDDVPEIEEMQKLVEEAEEFAETAAELEDYIKKAFEEALEEGGIDVEDYDEFVKGLMSAIFDTIAEEERIKREQAIEALNKVADKSAVKAVNWKTGDIKYFSKDEVLGRDWQMIQPIFTGLWDGGNEIVVDNTLEGAKKVADYFNIKETGKKSKTSAVFTTKNQDFMDILKRMRMFEIKTDWNNGGETVSISY
jgi:hypothetical protein